MFKNRYLAIVIVTIHAPGQGELPVIAGALRSLCGDFGKAQNRQQYRCNNRDDADDDKQFDKGECRFCYIGPFGFHRVDRRQRTVKLANEPSQGLVVSP